MSLILFCQIFEPFPQLFFHPQHDNVGLFLFLSNIKKQVLSRFI